MTRPVSFRRLMRVLDEANALIDRWRGDRDLGHISRQEAADRSRAKRLVDWVARQIPHAVLYPQVVCSSCQVLGDLDATVAENGRVHGFCSPTCLAHWMNTRGGYVVGRAAA